MNSWIYTHLVSSCWLLCHFASALLVDLRSFRPCFFHGKMFQAHLVPFYSVLGIGHFIQITLIYFSGKIVFQDLTGQ